jgi:hypothetical protein
MLTLAAKEGAGSSDRPADADLRPAGLSFVAASLPDAEVAGVDFLLGGFVG